MYFYLIYFTYCKPAIIDLYVYLRISFRCVAMNFFLMHKFNAEIKAGGWKPSLLHLRLWNHVWQCTACICSFEQVQIQCACVFGRPDAGCQPNVFSTLH